MSWLQLQCAILKVFAHCSFMLTVYWISVAVNWHIFFVFKSFLTPYILKAINFQLLLTNTNIFSTRQVMRISISFFFSFRNIMRNLITKNREYENRDIAKSQQLLAERNRITGCNFARIQRLEVILKEQRPEKLVEFLISLLSFFLAVSLLGNMPLCLEHVCVTNNDY